MPTSSYIWRIIDEVGEERITQIAWYSMYAVQALLLFRFFLKFIEASPKAEFLLFVYGVSKAFVLPFFFLPVSLRGDGVIEWAALFAIGTYTFLIWMGLKKLFARYYGRTEERTADTTADLGQEVGISNV